MWGATLSGPLTVNALVSRYLTNKLIAREPIRQRKPPEGDNPLATRPVVRWHHWVLRTVSSLYPHLPGRLSTPYSPVRRFTPLPKEGFSLDLHA